jgi:phosphoglucomutase
VSDTIDRTFRFVPLDWDGQTRMDCSSRWAMARLRDMAPDFDVAFATIRTDRHGVVTPRDDPAVRAYRPWDALAGKAPHLTAPQAISIDLAMAP